MSFFAQVCLEKVRAAVHLNSGPDLVKYYWISSLRLAGTVLACLGRVSVSTPSA